MLIRMRNDTKHVKDKSGWSGRCGGLKWKAAGSATESVDESVKWKQREYHIKRRNDADRSD